MTTPTTTREADAYLAEVRDHLDDLREEERAELLQDLAQHLADVSTDESNSDTDFRELLGSPAAYAAELRSAAGLPPREPTVIATDTAPGFSERLMPFWNHRWVAATRRFLDELAPAWWVVRGYLVAVLPFWIDAFGSSADDFPIPRYGGFPQLGVLLILASVAASVLLGRWGRKGRPQFRRMAALLALNALVLLAAANTYSNLRTQYLVISQGSLNQVSQLSQQVGSLSTSLETPYGTVTNIYPYDAQGNPLENVLLYDQDGRPLRAGKQEWWKDGCSRAALHPLAADGVPVEFSYPYRYRPVDQGHVAFESTSGQTVTQQAAAGCLAEIPRPQVPIPLFPPPAPAEGAPPPGP